MENYLLGQHAVPEDWKTHHLFVLVGTNPLPSFVAGKLLMHEEGTLHLVHSPDTNETARRIGAHFPGHVRHEVIDAAGAQEIQAVLAKALEQCANGKVGLNYTGGTKAMAVHAYRSIENRARELGQTVVLSYLDATTLSLRRDDRATGASCQLALQPKISDILDLHGIALDEKWPAERAVRCEPLYQALAKAHQSAEGQVAYDRWCQRYLRRPKKSLEDSWFDLIDSAFQPSELQQPDRIDRYRSLLASLRAASCGEADLVKKRSQFTELPIPFPSDPSLAEVADNMRLTFAVDGERFDPGEVSANRALDFKDVEEVVKFLDGDWLEHLVLAAFIANRKQCQLHDWAMSLRTTKVPYDFEFDVAAMRGYQLYAVSCTRSADRRLCKSKLFESHIRATQLGGDEARTGLVCCDRDPAALERQVAGQWPARSQRLKVFGPQDLPHLPDRFFDWLTR